MQTDDARADYTGAAAHLRDALAICRRLLDSEVDAETCEMLCEVIEHIGLALRLLEQERPAIPL